MGRQDSAKIREVMRQCHGCSNNRAENLLEKFDGDVGKAVAHFKSLAPFLSQPEISSSGSDDGTGDVDDQSDDQQDGSWRDPEFVDCGGPRPWYCGLPRITTPQVMVKGGEDGSGAFELDKVIRAIQDGTKAEEIRDYLSHYDDGDHTLRDRLNAEVKGFPAMFYVVETNNIQLIRHWIKYGGNPDVAYGADNFPLIGFAVLHGARTMKKATRTLEILLRAGASPHVIPEAFYNPFTRDLTKAGLEDEKMHDLDDSNKSWCTPEIRQALASALNLTQRYRLYQSSKQDPVSGREQQLVERKKAEEVLGVHQTIIGQGAAARSLKRRLLVNLVKPSKKPLVFVFAGPSGHGKTELARRFGDLMSLELDVVDCTSFKREMDLFGPRPGLEGSKDGSRLNNFMARTSGKRCVVFLDEFEKTTEEIQNTLLIPFAEGEYSDRRNGEKVDCSKTIWILATNAMDEKIHAFCKENESILFRSNDKLAQGNLVKQLCRNLRTEFVAHFGAPLAGRVSEILPFLTFTPAEQAVVAHKYVMDFEADVAGPVVLDPSKEHDELVGKVRLEVKGDATVCSSIAAEFYMPQLGARPIISGVEQTIAFPVIQQYLKAGDSFSEDQDETKFRIDINAEKEVEVTLVATKAQEVKVDADADTAEKMDDIEVEEAQ